MSNFKFPYSALAESADNFHTARTIQSDHGNKAKDR